MLMIRECEPLAIRRPTRLIEVAALEVSQDLLGAALRRTNRNLLLARDVRRVGDHLAIGRPGWMIIIGVRRLRQVACVAVLGRQREDIAAGGKDGPIAVGSNIEVGMLGRVLLTDRVLGIDPAWPRAGPIIWHSYVDVVKLLGRNIEDVQLAALLEHDGGIGA